MLFSAFRAQTKYIQFVSFLNITILLYKFILNFFKLEATYFFKFATLQANKMIVMFMAVFVLIPQRAIFKINLSAYVRFTHKLYRPSHRRITDSLMFFSYKVI